MPADKTICIRASMEVHEAILEDEVPPTHQQIHQAGRHLVVAEALIKGLSARVVGTQTFVELNGVRAQVQVAAKGAWMIENVDKYTEARIGTIILVDLTNGARDLYICPGDDLRKDVLERHRAFLAGHGGTRPRNPLSKHCAIEPADVAKWREGWAILR